MAKILVLDFAAAANDRSGYLRRLMTDLPAAAGSHEWLIPVSAASADRFAACAANVTLLPVMPLRVGIRTLQDSASIVRRLAECRRVELILASGNYGLESPPAPQVLVNRNAMYFSAGVLSDLKRSGAVRELLGMIMRHRMAVASMRSSDVVVVPTHAMAQDVMRWAPDLGPERFHVAWPGIDFTPTAGRAMPAGTRLVAPKSRTYRVLGLGRYHPSRNFETLFRAFAYLRKTLAQPVELVLTADIGLGIRDRGHDTTRAACLLEELELVEDTRILGPQPIDVLPWIYREVDVAVNPSRLEPTGLMALAAMAYGCPLITADHAAHRELCGYAADYFDPTDPIDLANQITHVLTNGELAEHRCNAGRQRASLFSWENHTRCVAQAIDRVLVANGVGACDRRKSA